MIRVVVIKNPFSPGDGREIHTIEYCAGKTVTEYTKAYMQPGLEESDMMYVVNGYVVDGKAKCLDGALIVMSPIIGKGHKNPLMIVAAIALSVGAMSIGAGIAGVAGKGLAAASGWSAIGGYMAAAAVMYVGGSLINHWAGGDKTGYGGDTSNSPTYSWDGITTTEGQGNAIPITYGTVKSGGQTLNKFVTVSNDKQYLSWLLSAGEGPLEITDVQINKNPAAYYENVQIDIRKGLNQQDIISNFSDTISTQSMSMEILETGWRTFDVEGDVNEGLMVEVECTNGLYHVKDNGDLENAYIDLSIQYHKSGGDWKNFNGDKQRIEAAQSSAVRRQYRIDNIEAGKYTVRIKIISRQYTTTSTRASTRIWWSSVSGIVYDDFSYPGIALLGIKALATEQLSGMPTITFIKTRSKVLVYNPGTKRYEQKDATNPAWAAYDFIHRAIDLNGDQSSIDVQGAPADLMMYDRFKTWADWCDKKDLKINIEITDASDLMDAVNSKIAPVGHGRVVLFGVKFGCVYDAPVDAPVQMFTMGNIISGSFEEEFSQVDDRANAVEITFNNKEKDYDRDTVTVYSSDYDDPSSYNTTTAITVNGITDYKQAYRYGKYQLACNQRLVRTCKFKAAIDAIACTVGDVISIAHDVPQWACSGRVTAVSGNTVTIGGILENYDKTATYRIQYRASASDNLYIATITNITIDDSGVTGTISDMPKEPPTVNDIADIARQDINSKLFTVKSITRSNDGSFTRTISALEYSAAVFNEDYTVPDINYADINPTAAVNVSDLSGKQISWRDSAGNFHTTLNLSWKYGRPYERFSIALSEDGKTWQNIGTTTSLYFSCETKMDTTYHVRVVTISKASASSGSEIIVSSSNNDIPAINIMNLESHTQYRQGKDGNHVYDIVTTWQPDGLAARVYYKVNNQQTANLTIEEGVSVDQLGFSSPWTLAGECINSCTIPQVVPGDEYQIAVATRTCSGEFIHPDKAAQTHVIVAKKTELPNTPDNFRVEFTDHINASWNSVTNTDLAYYEIRTNLNEGQKDGMLVRTQDHSATITLTEREGNLYLYAVSSMGYYSVPNAIYYSKPRPAAPAPPRIIEGLGQIGITTDSQPADCTGVDIYINEQYVGSGPTLTWSCEAGIYDVTAAFRDIFGSGAMSGVSRATIKAKVDQNMLAEQAVTMKNVDETISKAINDVQKTLPEGIEQNNKAVKAVIDELNKAPENSGYKSISELKKDADDISATVAQNKTAQDGTNKTMLSKIEENASSISTVVANLNKAPGDTGYTSISSLQQTAESISSTVSTNKDNQDKINAAQNETNSTLTSKITQTASSISTVVANLNDADKAKTYSAILQMSDAIATKISEGDMTSYLQQDHTGFYIKGSLINIDGTTKIGSNVITKDMIQSNAVTAEKINVNSLSAITATIGTLRTKASGARVEIKDNLIEVYDNNNVLRVRMGVW